MLANDKQKVLFIVNPCAGRSKSPSDIANLEKSLADQGFLVTTHCTSAPKEAIAVAREQAPLFDRIVCCGGDGTLNEVMSGVIQSQHSIPIGYIPAGSTNDLARTLGLTRQVSQSVQIAATGAPVYHDVGQLNGAVYFSYVASFGAFTQVSYSTPTWMKHLLGHFAYILESIRALTQIRSYHAKVRADGVEVEGDFIFGSISNSTSIGGFLQFSRQDVCLNDGKFEVLLIRNPHNPIRFFQVMFHLRHQRYDKNYVEFLHASQVEIQFDRDVGWTADGEYAGSHSQIQIETLHDRIQIVRGPEVPDPVTSRSASPSAFQE